MRPLKEAAFGLSFTAVSIRDEEEEKVSRIGEINQQIASLPELERRRRSIVSECRDYELRIARLAALEEPLTRWKGMRAEKRFFGALADESNDVVTSLADYTQSLELTSTSLTEELHEAPHHALTTDIAAQANQLLESTKRVLSNAISVFQHGMEGLLRGDRASHWKETFEAEKAKYEALRDELTSQGTDPDQYLSYEENLREAKERLDETVARIDALNELRNERDGYTSEGGERRPGIIDELQQLWARSTTVREEAATKLRDTVPTTNTGRPFVEVAVCPYGDEDAFVAKLSEEIRDGRRITAEDWDSFMRVVHALACAQKQPPTEVLSNWVAQMNSGVRPNGCPWTLDEHRTSVLLEWLTEDRLADLRAWRTPDRLRVELFRQDGSRVGELDGPELSVGQRCTAVLALLLARDEIPVVLDQPEEDLDNEFIFHEFVPLLRRVKEQRQLIVVSHIANTPVNADAEFILALEVRDQKGHIKQLAGDNCVGALDRDAVKRAVEDIMEGSEEAFRRRHEKYGF